MNIEITYKNILPDEPLKVFVDDKIGSLDRYLKGKITSARVEIGKPSRHHRHGNVFYAEANLKIDGKIMRAQATHTDLRSAIVDVKEKLRIELTKMKDKISKKRVESRK